MIDDDIKPTPAHFFRIVSHAERLVGALYPKKNLTGLCWVGEFKAADEKTMGPGGLWPMDHVAAGMIRVDLSVVDELIGRYPERGFMWDEDDPESGIAEGQWMHDLWSMGVVKTEYSGTDKHPLPRVYPRYLPEDYFFSHLAKTIGVPLWTDPEVQVGHVGPVDFLAIYAMVDKRIAEALAAYKGHLQAAGLKVPLLEIEPNGNVRVARIN